MVMGTRKPAGNKDLGTRVQNLYPSRPYSSRAGRFESYLVAHLQRLNLWNDRCKNNRKGLIEIADKQIEITPQTGL